jgi:hypothetical protein
MITESYHDFTFMAVSLLSSPPQLSNLTVSEPEYSSLNWPKGLPLLSLA